jgi:hypothetical protein
MKMTASRIAVATALAAGLGSITQVNAGIYAGVSLQLENLAITFTPSSQVPPFNPTFSDFQFSLTNSADLTPGGSDPTSAGCTGNLTATGGTTTCGPGGPGTPVLYAGTADVGNPTRAGLDTVTGTPYLGPGGQASVNNYASSDSIIDRSELVDFVNGVLPPNPSATRQISEAELAVGTQSAAGNAINSTSTLSWDFGLATSGTITIEFDADIGLLAEFNDLTATGATASASSEFKITLSGDAGFTWTPTKTDADVPAGLCNNGVSDLNLAGESNASCVSQSVGESLNQQVAAAGSVFDGTQNANVDDKSWDTANSPLTAAVGSQGYADAGLQHFALTMLIDNGGDFSLVLDSKTNAQVTRQVPSPSSMLLLSAGLIGAGAVARRRKVKKA